MSIEAYESRRIIREGFSLSFNMAGLALPALSHIWKESWTIRTSITDILNILAGFTLQIIKNIEHANQGGGREVLFCNTSLVSNVFAAKLIHFSSNFVCPVLKQPDSFICHLVNDKKVN